MATKDILGRGTDANPPNRYEQLHVELDETPPDDDEGTVAPQTVFYRDTSRSILAENDSPDVGFRFSLNPTAAASTDASTAWNRPRPSCTRT